MLVLFYNQGFSPLGRKEERKMYVCVCVEGGEKDVSEDWEKLWLCMKTWRMGIAFLQLYS